ncbi:MAG TPA: AAA family ATPase, partial [Ktedonobacteraceae bacterium]|nr:AAA family ATPase [Ktedonobacteraceae bacterium]
MLLELNIRDFAIIDSLHLRLHRLFNVFTGETGAGKSIIIDAVSTLLGGKIGVEVVRSGCDRATVEGVFSIGALPPISDGWQPFEATLNAEGNGAGTMFEALAKVETQQAAPNHADAESADAGIALATLLHAYDIKPEDGVLILSRDIFISGRTVGRINGRTVTQQVLQQVASWLVDIHGQSEHMSLLRPEQHVNFLDRYADLLPLREQLGARVTEWRSARKTLLSLQQNEREQARRAEFLRYEIEEIEKAELRAGEIEELEEERKVLSNAERLRELCTIVYGSIKGGEGGDDYQPALDQLRPALKALSDLARLDKDMQEHETNLSEAIYRLEDVAASISSYESDIEDDPQRLEEIEERLDLIARLKRKYGVTTVEEVLQRAASDHAELDSITHRDELIASLQKQDSEFSQEIGRLAQELSARRHEAAARLA